MNRANASLQILVVGGSRADAEHYEDLLRETEGAGYAFRHVETGNEGLQTIRAGVPDCVIVHCDLPDLGYPEFLAAKAREQADRDHWAAAVLIVGRADAARAAEAQSLGAQGYLVKEDLGPHYLRSVILGAMARCACEYQLHQSQSFQADLLSRVAGDLQATLTIVRTFIQTAAGGVDTNLNSSQTSCLQAALKNCDRMGNALQDLFGSGTAGGADDATTPLNRRSVDLTALIPVCVRELLPICCMKYQRLEVSSPETLPPVLCDPEVFSRMLAGLIRKAHVLTPEGGLIRVKVRESDMSGVIIEVDSASERSDVNDNTIPHLTMREDSTSPPQVFMTEGLRTADRIITAHDGRVLLCSYREGRFYIAFTLPIYNDTMAVIAQLSDGLHNALANEKELAVVLLGARSSHAADDTTQSNQADRELQRMEQAIQKQLRRRDDRAWVWESRRIVVVVAQVSGTGGDVLRRRMEWAAADELGPEIRVASAFGVLHDGTPVGDKIEELARTICLHEPDRIRKRVLIFGEDRVTADIVSRTLESARFDLRTEVVDGVQGFEGRLNDFRPDLTIVITTVEARRGVEWGRLVTLVRGEVGSALLLIGDAESIEATDAVRSASEVLLMPLDLLKLIEKTAQLLDLETPVEFSRQQPADSAHPALQTDRLDDNIEATCPARHIRAR